MVGQTGIRKLSIEPINGFSGEIKLAGNVNHTMTLWIIIVVLAMILPIEALRNALVGAFNQITSNLNAIP
ncbi:hypothetical protein [Sulfobacillus thermosulfidooxidans]|uniref:hypothetical protein n=1 Tax=Sulfobacillus thermosulfidooxidans TaxID=28034 RepID=UPI0006B59B7C|nr:hypothetical protein [Sulfobacillus thermosulfidooxidans]